MTKLTAKNSTNLDGDISLASSHSCCKKLQKRIRVRGLHTRRPSLVVLVAEEHVTVVRVDSAGKVLLVHLRAAKSVLRVVGGSR